MKNLLFLLLAALLPCLLACEKEEFYPAPSALFVSSIGPSPGCGWRPCNLAIAEAKQAYQALANSLCDTVWVEVICCQDGAEAYALVFVAPQPEKCSRQVSIAVE